MPPDPKTHDKPFDALTATQAEVDQRIRDMTRDAYRRQADAAVERTVAAMRAKYPEPNQ